MRLGRIFVCAGILFFAAGSLKGEAVTLVRQANKDLKGIRAVSLNEVLSLPEDQVDLATAALIISLEAGGKISGRKKSLKDYTHFLDDQALKIWYRLQPEASAEAVLDEIAKVLFEALGFSAGDEKEELLHSESSLDFLDEVIDRKKGNCMGLSLLYLGIAERLGFPLKGVELPGHMIVRYEDAAKQINVETMAGGRRYEGMKIWQEDYGAQPGLPLNDKAMSKREMLASFMANAALDYERAKRLEEARQLGLLAQSVSQDHPNVINNLAVGYNHLGIPERAVELLESFLARHPEAGTEVMAMNLGVFYVNMKAFDKAAEHFEKMRAALEKTASSVQTPTAAAEAGARLSGLQKLYANLGYVYANLGKKEKAGFFLKKATELNPYDPWVFFYAGQNEAAGGNTKGAIENYKKAVGLDGEFAAAHYNLGVQYWNLGDNQSARYHFQRARDLGFEVSDATFKSLARPSLRSQIQKVKPDPEKENPQLGALLQELSKYGVSTAESQEKMENETEKKVRREKI